ncbi:MAG TPA: hypothetical protein VGX00_00660 [Thermoplasmata archaeon]|nr:hypothetical protein [Thermoplasmata archaeon]
MTESVAIPKDLFEKIVDAVNELQAIYGEVDDGDDRAAPEHEFDAARIEKLVEEIEENWPQESFNGEYPPKGTGHKYHRQTKLSGSNHPR